MTVYSSNNPCLSAAARDQRRSIGYCVPARVGVRLCHQIHKIADRPTADVMPEASKESLAECAHFEK